MVGVSMRAEEIKVISEVEEDEEERWLWLSIGMTSLSSSRFGEGETISIPLSGVRVVDETGELLSFRLFCPSVCWDTVDGFKGSAQRELYPSQTRPSRAQLWQLALLVNPNHLIHSYYRVLGSHLGLASSHLFRLFLHVKHPERDHLAPSRFCLFLGPSIIMAGFMVRLSTCGDWPPRHMSRMI